MAATNDVKGTMSPLGKHLEELARREKFLHDPAQQEALQYLDRLYTELAARSSVAQDKPRFFSRFLSAVGPLSRIKGVYLWGGVGRGKTRLMDMFFDAVPVEGKTRMHFQRFMRLVHNRLKELPQYPDPLPVVAAQLAQQYRLIGFDEFHVDDVADAMLLSGLLHAFIEQGVVFVFTSNLAPDELYLNGLQRERFLPAIDLIYRVTDVVHLSGDTDFRRLAVKQSLPGFMLETPENLTRFGEWFASQSPQWTPNVTLQIHGRAFPAKAVGEGMVWFDFQTLCKTKRSSMDYLELCDRFSTWFISGIHVMGEYDDDVANRFIQLIDALYDHKVRLFASARVPLAQLYQGRRLAFPFQRTASRLSEMLSKD